MTTEAEKERLRNVRAQAREEIYEEDFRAAVDEMKTKLRRAKWWHTLIPWQIIIRRRKASE
jgi:hypothetical protein